MYDPADPRASKLVRAARDIIRETGTFDLPMRQLAARAQTSLRTPYEIFGSKSGIIMAILRSDQRAFREISNSLKSANVLNYIFDTTMAGIEFYTHEQPFYRALFRATQGYTGTGGSEPVREIITLYIGVCQRGQDEGYIRSEINVALLAETLTSLFAANLRHWALSDFDVLLAGNRICYGLATTMAGAVTDSHLPSMRERILQYQRAIQAIESAEAEQQLGH